MSLIFSFICLIAAIFYAIKWQDFGYQACWILFAIAALWAISAHLASIASEIREIKQLYKDRVTAEKAVAAIMTAAKKQQEE